MTAARKRAPVALAPSPAPARTLSSAELEAARDRALQVAQTLGGLLEAATASPRDQGRVLELVEALTQRRRALSADEELVADGLVDTEGACAYLAVSASTLDGLRQRGEIAFVRIGGVRDAAGYERGGCVRYARRELVQYAAARRQGGAS